MRAVKGGARRRTVLQIRLAVAKYPHNFASQAILYVPRSFPEPKSAEYFLRALREIREILKITEGHAFLLFTSFQQMNRFYRSLQERLEFPLLRQGDMPKTRLL